MSLIEAKGLTKKYGKHVALDGVDFRVEAGRIVGLIGPNGAGKTSLFNCISRLYNPSEGRIAFDGVDITRYRSKDIAALGVARTFQNLALMKSLTVFNSGGTTGLTTNRNCTMHTVDTGAKSRRAS